MALITPPARLPVREDSWQLDVPAHENVSAWSGSRQVLLLPGPRWTCSLSFAPLSMDGSAKAWRSFLTSLRGIANQFIVYAEPSAQTAFANPLVKGAGQTGYQLVVDGLNNGNGNAVLSAGDWLTVTLPNTGVQLLMVKSCTNTLAGEATITFEPRLREAPADNAPVEIQDPYAYMSASSKELGFSRDVMLWHKISFSAKETW